MFKKILIANRGEIAVRIMETCAELGIRSVAVHSSSDRNAYHVRKADEAVDLGDGPASENYLNLNKIIAAAKDTGAEAIHPGYGFLAENAEFAYLVEESDLIFVGPSGHAISIMGEKVTARAVALEADVPLIPGSEAAVSSVAEVSQFGANYGFPILVKASAGGGGRGMRRIDSIADVEDAFHSAVREASAAFGNGEVYLERYLTDARHVEVQVFADAHGNTVYYGDRDCSVQRRHQKLVEEAPAPGLPNELRRMMGDAAVRLAQQVGYCGAGTVEFMVEDGKFYFLEMNTRIQVEHPVTELVQDMDLIAEQIRVAAGEPLSVTESGRQPRGVAIEARINAEDVAQGAFLPAPGLIEELQAPAAEHLRFDTGYESGDEVSPYYDSLVGKLVAWGPDRAAAISKLIEGLEALHIKGVETTIPAALRVLNHEDFQATKFNTRWLESSVDFSESDDDVLLRNETEINGRFYVIPYFDESHMNQRFAGVSTPPSQDGLSKIKRKSNYSKKRTKKESDGTVTVPMQGTIIETRVSSGEVVEAGQTLFVLEAMKMENPIKAPLSGTISDLEVELGTTVAAGTRIAFIQSEEVKV